MRCAAAPRPSRYALVLPRRFVPDQQPALPQLRELCLELGHQMTTDEITQMLTAMDKTGSNTVTLDGARPIWIRLD